MALAALSRLSNPPVPHLESVVSLLGTNTALGQLIMGEAAREADLQRVKFLVYGSPQLKRVI